MLVDAARVRVALAAAALLIAIAAPVPAYAATPTTTVLTAEPEDPEANEPFCFRATTTVTAGGGSVGGSSAVEIYETTTGSDVDLGGVGYQFGQPSTGTFCLDPGFSVGMHTFRGDYHDFGGTYEQSSDTLELNVSKATPDWYLNANPASPEAGEQIEITANFFDNGINEEDSLEIHLSGEADPICTQAPNTDNLIVCTVAAPSTPGTYQLTVSNSGSASVEAATSDPLDLVVQQNQVHASNVGVQYSTFYPVKDGYRDTVAITGTRDEPIEVTIRIYSPGGTLLKTQTIAEGSGAYSYAWNGRKADGTIRPAGTYKVTQTLDDALGASEMSTFFVTLSKKEVTWHSTSITQKGSSLDAVGSDGDGRVTRNTTAGWARLKALDPFSDWAGAGWQFSLHSGIGYKDVVVKVYAKHGLVLGPTRLGAQDFSECSTWSESCFDTWKNLAGSVGSTVWTSTNELSLDHVSGTKVRSLVSVYGSDVYVYKARVSYKYATLS
jgi:flagellar hook capping protein FlgD